jgi:hypothetical protein
VNRECYQEVLEENLMRFMDINKYTHCLQNGALCHAFNCRKVFLAKQSSQVIDWPGNSPNFNPIENCWDHMNNLLKEKDILMVLKLAKESKELWTHNLQKQSDSMPSRLQMGTKAKAPMKFYLKNCINSVSEMNP